MRHASIRVRTPDGVGTGTYMVPDGSSLADLEDKRRGVSVLGKALYASGMETDPFAVTEAVVLCNKLTYRYEAAHCE